MKKICLGLLFSILVGCGGGSSSGSGGGTDSVNLASECITIIDFAANLTFPNFSPGGKKFTNNCDFSVNIGTHVGETLALKFFNEFGLNAGQAVNTSVIVPDFIACKTPSIPILIDAAQGDSRVVCS